MTKEEQEHRDATLLREKCIKETKVVLTIVLKDNGCDCNSPVCWSGVKPVLESQLDLVGIPRTLWPQIGATAILAAQRLLKDMADRLPKEYRKAFLMATNVEAHHLGGINAIQVIRDEHGQLNPDGSEIIDDSDKK